MQRVGGCVHHDMRVGGKLHVPVADSHVTAGGQYELVLVAQADVHPVHAVLRHLSPQKSNALQLCFFYQHVCTQTQRSVVKYGGSSWSVRSSHQTVSAFRSIGKLVLPSIFDTSLLILGDVKLAELSNNSFE